MAKGKGKRTSGANEIVAEKSASASDAQAAPNVPQIDESAFAGLRQKIEQRLKDQNSGKGKSKKNEKSDKPAESTPTKKNATPSKGQDSAQGRKRDRNGEVIARDEKKEGKNKAGKAPKKGGDDETLRQEILALGGTEEDFDLLAGVDSEDEVEGVKAKGGDDDLRKELSKMLEAAGHVVPQDVADEDVEEEEDEDEEEEEEQEESPEDIEDEDMEDASDDADDEPEDISDISDVEEAPKEPAVVVPKEYANLVSYYMDFALWVYTDIRR